MKNCLVMATHLFLTEREKVFENRNQGIFEKMNERIDWRLTLEYLTMILSAELLTSYFQKSIFPISKLLQNQQIFYSLSAWDIPHCQ